MKHCHLALIDENFLSVILLTKDSLYDKMFGNLNEIKSRKDTVVLFTSESNNDENLDVIDKEIMEMGFLEDDI